MNQPKTAQPGSAASTATDVPEFITDLDGGQFERKLGAALSRVAAAVVDNGEGGEVTIKLKLKPIEGSQQVHCEHTLKFVRPTEGGKASEEDKRVTALHVGVGGKMSLLPPHVSMNGQTQIR